MKAQLFQDLVLSHARARGRRTRGLPYSLLLHGLALGALIVLPLLGEDRLSLPEPDLFKVPIVFAASPPAGGGNPAPRRPTTAGRSVPARSARSSFVLPTEAPVLEPADPTGTLDPGLVGACFGDECGRDGGEGLGDGAGGGAGEGGEGPPARIVQVGIDVQPPTKIHDVTPVYPEMARRIGVQGVVVIECMIAPNGRVANARVLKGHPLLDQAALDAVNQWVYVPTRVNGAPVAVLMTVTVKFHFRR